MSANLKPAVLEIENHWLEYPNGIPIESWGCDHHSTLLYAETRAVDHGGRLLPNDPHMRMAVEYPTRLNNGVNVIRHTDYDCLTDAQHAGLLTWDESEGAVRFTDAGWAYVHNLRRKRAERALENATTRP
jgi:hypothetical protein